MILPSLSPICDSKLLAEGIKKRRRTGQLRIREIMTILFIQKLAPIWVRSEINRSLTLPIS
jgi:hypothetical protein